MNSNLAVIYLSILVGLLFLTVISVFRQIFKSRKQEGSFSKLRSKLSKETGSIAEYYQLGSIYSQKKLFTQAVSLFQKAIKAADEQQEETDAATADYVTLAYNGLGYAYFAQEQYDLAIRNYKEALKRQPDYVTALNNLGHAYERKKLNAQALESYEKALELDAKNAVAKRRAQSLRRLVTA
ncbi:tetratricopeptide repeat protein [Plectonema cf. radiosum LEGE 06105]|uniref:Tetratricopeptide repeat protein n=1 Tax=Plectonema cf. radiosum LEGE 06105 TaxID=945769 RepID=A0A8J7FGQ0_9CYAN|nr:tetratricopeptide repeat protein [Plectonema radiosum]MBE9213506.1 tetratricopeptide repeat protein [Plectonema cf. radiosum LEGE 06105]